MQAASQMTGDNGFKSRITQKTLTDAGATNPISIDDLTLSASDQTALKQYLGLNSNNLISQQPSLTNYPPSNLVTNRNQASKEDI